MRPRPTILSLPKDAASAAKIDCQCCRSGCAQGRARLENFAVNPAMAIVEADQPRLWFARAAKLMKSAPPKPLSASAGSDMGADVKLGTAVTIGAGAVIGSNACDRRWNTCRSGSGDRRGRRDRRELPYLSARSALSRDHAGESRGCACGRGAWRRWIWVCARCEDRRLHAVSATGNAVD